MNDSNFLLKTNKNQLKSFKLLATTKKRNRCNHKPREVLPIKLAHITKKEQYNTIRILRITFCEGLKQGSFIKWQDILQKNRKNN